MTLPTASFRVRVDATNPGQFFACCALLELSDRLRPGAQGWFEGGDFCVASGQDLPATLASITRAALVMLDATDAKTSPMWMDAPFNFRLDWWKSDNRMFTDLKIWSGSMEAPRICWAMQRAMSDMRFGSSEIFNLGAVVYRIDKPTKKVEPFYFDARRGSNAHPRDVGFSPNKLKVTTIAFPAVEFLCFVGLQRALPRPVTGQPRNYDYFLWSQPIEAPLLPAAVNGFLPNSKSYRFESWCRTGRKEHKAFLKAKPTPSQPQT